MSDAALAIFGIIFGWGLCALVLRWNRPLIFRDLGPVRWPRFPRRPIMPPLSERGRIELEKLEAAYAKQRLTEVRWWFGAALFAAATFAILLVLLEQAHLRAHEAWEVEAFLSTPRFASFMLTAALGFGCRAHVREITAGLYAGFLIALVSTSKDESKKLDAPSSTAPATPGAPATANGSPEAPPADAPAKVEGAADAKPGKVTGSFDAVLSKFPWFVEIGILASMVVAVVLLLNPQLLKNVTSFKAGGVEAHFATANGTATVQSGQLVTVDLARKTTTQGWTEFAYPPPESDYRFMTYPNDDNSKKDREDAGDFFKNYLFIIFEYLSLDEKTRSDLDLLLHQYISDISIPIMRGDETIDPKTTNALSKIAPQLCNAIFLKQKATIRNNALCAYYNNNDHILTLSNFKIKHWDPYIIQAVGDLLFIIATRREQEDFLVETTKNEKLKDAFCPDTCDTAGQLSLAYAVMVAKIRSERPWPFQKMIDDLKKTLVGIDTVLDHNNNEWRKLDKTEHNKTTDTRYITTDTRFRRNRLIDLNLGLELFYQRAIQGQRLTAEQRQTWRDWLTEVKSFLGLLDAVGQWPPPFDDDTLASWKRVRNDTWSRPDIPQDAYVGAALSLVLIDPSDDVAPQDCATALSFLKKADDAEKAFAVSTRLNEDEKGTYRGFLEQVRSIVEGRCRS